MHIGSTMDLFRHLHRSPLAGLSSANRLSYVNSTVNPPVPETDRLELSNAHKLESVKNKVQTKNLEVERFMKSITSILGAMKDLAKLAEREQLVQDACIFTRSQYYAERFSSEADVGGTNFRSCCARPIMRRMQSAVIRKSLSGGM